MNTDFLATKIELHKPFGVRNVKYSKRVFKKGSQSEISWFLLPCKM